MATKKKKDDEESFASKLAGVGDALSEGGEDEAESSLESISKIVDGISDIAEARKAAKEAKLTKNAVKGGQGDYSWGGPEEKKQVKTDKAVKGGKGDFSDFGAVKDFFGDLGSGALSTLGMLDPRVIASMGKSKENIAALSTRIDNNKKRLGEESVNKNGIVTSVNEVLEFAGTNASDPPPDSSDKSLFTVGKKQQLDPNNPTHGVVAKAYTINHKNATANEETTNYQMMRKTADERQKRRMEDKLAEGNPLKQFELDKQRGVGTPVNELFKKPEDVNKVEENKQIETEVKNEDKKIENTDKIIDEGAKLTDSVKDIDGKIGDFFDPDKLKFKSLFGNMA